jgi:uncharacterized membrane protein YbhN (UPF0104 family)
MVEHPTPSEMISKAQPKRSRAAKFIGAAASLGIFAASIAVLYHLIQEVSLADVETAFRKAGQDQLWLAALFTIVSYTLLAGYDALALRQLQVKISAFKVILASFTSYAISFTLGFPIVTAGTVRYWIYSSSHVSASKVISLTLIAGMTFILGMATVLGIGLVWQSDAIGHINQLAISINRMIGMAVLSGIFVYLVWAAAKRRHVKIHNFVIELPTIGVSAGQLFLGAADVCAAAAVLYVLLPERHGIAFETFAAVYAFASLLGVASNAPGGLGVFEATMLLAFQSLPKDGMIGALLLFRLCYYLAPFAVAVVALGLYEIVIKVLGLYARHRRNKHRA